MRKLILYTVLIPNLLFASQVYAGAGHDHGHGHGHAHAPVSKKAAEQIAKNSVNQFIKRESIEKSWSSATLQSAEQKEFGGRMEWIITLRNEKASKAKEQLLYVFLTLDGQYIAANYTGD